MADHFRPLCAPEGLPGSALPSACSPGTVRLLVGDGSLPPVNDWRAMNASGIPVNEENFRGCRSSARNCPLPSFGCRPVHFCSRRRPPPRDYESEALILRLPCVPAAVPASRRYTRELTSSWRIAPPVTDTIALVVSELVTNAVRHSVGRHLPPQRDDHLRHFDLAVCLTAKHVRVEVYDEERRLPVDVEAHEYAETGRGMKIIQFCGVRWGARRVCTGKVVWCEVGLPEPSRVGGALVTAAGSTG
ncbi:hypothetical protein C6376_40100 [Streptomyces sp. P3]|nr:hypothetical protein C6376_40100 [Streptomyces sp. P3]